MPKKYRTVFRGKKSMNIAIAINEKYIPYAYVMLTSLMENHRHISRDITVYVLYGSIPDEKFMIFEQLEEKYRCSIVALQVPMEEFPDHLPHTDQWSVEVYFRLMLQDLLPETVDRLLYLDSDIIICNSIEEYYNTEFGNKILAVNADMSAKHGGLHPKQEVLFAGYIRNGDFTYFNAGIMLMNLKALREEFTFGRFMEEFSKRRNNIVAQEQDLLNDLFYGRVIFADENKYDLFAKIAYNEGRGYAWAKENASIIHFAGWKPWDGDGLRYDTEKIWWEYARLTPMYEQLLERLIFDEMEMAYADTTIRRLAREKDELMGLIEKLKGVVTAVTGENL